jgi:predicted lysophospholipase L1 biosynthesis ABC-type transport system permease subunit
MIKAGSRSITFVVLGVITIVLAILLVITLTRGDTSDNLENNQPSPSPESSSAS